MIHKVTFSAEGLPSVTVLQDSDPAVFVSGYGGWVVVSRDRRIGLTQWNGKDPLRMTVSVIFDGLRKGLGQEIDISHLSRMALPPVGGGEPPTVKVAGPGIPSGGPDVWVIENLQWGNNVIWDFSDNGSYVRMRQDCKVNLLQYVAGDRLEFKAIQPGGIQTGSTKAGWPKQYIVATGDTLRLIAGTLYTDHGGASWQNVKTIMAANNIRDPKNIFVGQVLRIPAP